MPRYSLLSFLLFPLLAFADHDGIPPVEIARDPSSMVHDCVNVITGSYCDFGCPLKLAGPSNLSFCHGYCSLDASDGKTAGGWNLNDSMLAYMYVPDGDKLWHMQVNESDGISYKLRGNRKTKWKEANDPKEKPRRVKGPDGDIHFNQSLPETLRGMTNTSAGWVSGTTNYRNDQWIYHHGGKFCEKIHANGTIGHYVHRHEWATHFRDYVRDWEVCPNGTKLLYLTDRPKIPEQGVNLYKIVAKDASDKHVFGHIDIPIDKKCNNRTDFRVSLSDGRWVRYQCVNCTAQSVPRVGSIISSHCPPIRYHYHTHSKKDIKGRKKHEQVKRKELPDNRFLDIQYYTIGNNLAGGVSVYVGEKDKARRKHVRELSAPVGHDASPQLIYSFQYHFSDRSTPLAHHGITEVRNAFHHRTDYGWSAEERLEAVYRFTGKDKYKLYSVDRLLWGKGEHQTDLVCRTLEEANGAVRSYRHFAYDKDHNPVAETLYGDLTGENKKALQIKEGAPVKNGCECMTVKRSYSQDRFHNVLTEQFPNGRSVHYQYKPETNLCTMVLVKVGEQIVKRTFRSYDIFGAVCRIIEDDGISPDVQNLSGATHRLITRITNRDKAPCMGMARETSCQYVDLKTRKEHLLERVFYQYTRTGQVCKEEHYDATNTFRYSLVREYDHMGNTTLEKDAMGRVTRYRYDANGNKIWEQGPDTSFHMEFRYDFVNRLIAEEIVIKDGTRYTKSFRYDHVGNKIADINLRGHETNYDYDELQRRVSTTSPLAYSIEGKALQATQRQGYDIAGHLMKQVDALGQQTNMRYTIRGQVAEIMHPDGRVESKRYHLNGTLAKEVRANGSYIEYQYDALDREVSKQTYSAAGELLSSESKTYRGLLLVTETNANGYITRYEYDGAARRSAVVTDHSRQQIQYDALGRERRIIKWVDDAHARVCVKERDLLDRVIEERVEELDGCVLSRTLSSYDHKGNCTDVTIFTEEGAATTHTDYDPLGRVIRMTNPEGHSTVTTYDEWFVNEQGQKVLCITDTDAMGTQTITVHNAWDKPVRVTKKDPYGALLAQHQLSYDLAGRVTERVETVIAARQENRQVRTRWSYDCCGRCIQLEEGVGTKLSRTTRTIYNAYGEKAAVAYSDGTVLESLYDAFGRLERYRASDGSVDYCYSYDQAGNLLGVIDSVCDTITQRRYDSAQRVIEESLAHGLSVSYSYDGLGRFTQVMLHDGSAVRYTYDAANLKKVTRLDTQGNELYSHQYLDYDLAGSCLKTQLIGSAGEVEYTYDLLGRQRSQQAPNYREEIPAGGYDVVGKLLHKQHFDSEGELDCRFAYDGLYQLVSEESLHNHSYAYDSLHNRLFMDEEECVVNVLNELLAQGDTSFTYDSQGNRTAELGENETFYSYDALGRLCTVTRGEQSWEYQYDSFNRRLCTVHRIDDVEQTQVRYLYDGQNEIGAVDREDHIVQFRALGSGLGAEIGASIAIETHEGVFASLHDHSGHIVALLDAGNGETCATYRYSAFGEEERYGQVESPWRFASKRADSETGLLNFGRRYYDPKVGRWISPDPKGFEVGPNLYAYVYNRPLTLFDLYGLDAQTQDYFAMNDAGLSWDSCKYLFGPLGNGLVNGTCSVYREGTGVCRQNLLVTLGYTDAKTCAEEHSHNGHLEGWRHPHFIANWNPGQETTPQDCYKVVGWLQQEFDGMQIGYRYNSTYGKFWDSGESIATKLKIPNKGVRMKVYAMREGIAAVGGVGSDGRVLEICHSQGAMQAHAALSELSSPEQAMFDLITIGAAELSTNPHVGFRMHHVHMQDFVPWAADTLQMYRACKGERGDVTLWGERGMPNLEVHGVWSEHYQEGMKQSFDFYREQHPGLF